MLKKLGEMLNMLNQDMEDIKDQTELLEMRTSVCDGKMHWMGLMADETLQKKEQGNRDGNHLNWTTARKDYRQT